MKDEIQDIDCNIKVSKDSGCINNEYSIMLNCTRQNFVVVVVVIKQPRVYDVIYNSFTRDKLGLKLQSSSSFVSTDIFVFSLDEEVQSTAAHV